MRRLLAGCAQAACQKNTTQASRSSCQMPSTARQLRQLPTIEAIGRVPYFADVLIQLYKKWYRQRKNNKQKDFYIQLDEKVVQDIPITEKRISYIKGVLIITLKDLEEGLTDQRSNKRIVVLVNKGLTFRSLRQRFKLKDKDKLRVNLKYLVYYTLVQIIYIQITSAIYIRR